MKTVLAFGDSLTFGYDCRTGGRHAYQHRWPSALERELHGLARVIAEGLGGRTTNVDDPTSLLQRNGKKMLPTLLDSHEPLDLVVIMLGTNDLRVDLDGSASRAAEGMRELISAVREHPYMPGAPVPGIVLVSPPLIDHTRLGPPRLPRVAESHLLARNYERVAAETDCAFFDAATVVTSTDVDGVHLDAANTQVIGRRLAPLVKKLIVAHSFRDKRISN